MPLRHPSQLYEAFGEGLLLAVVLWLLLRRRVANASEKSGSVSEWSPLDGTLAAVFLMGYAAVRFIVEFFRQPDTQFRGPGDPVGVVLGPFSMGQVISAVMFAAGVAMIAKIHRSHRKVRPT